MVKTVLVVGGGSAGFIAALTLKVKLPHLRVRIIRSSEIGIIGVGEGSTASLTTFLHDYIKINPKKFYDVARPTFKLGLRFIWGRRPYFNFAFGPGPETMTTDNLPKPWGFYADRDMEFEDYVPAFMNVDRVFERMASGPKLHSHVAYHFENEKFVRFLEEYARALGVEIADDTIVEVDQDQAGITALRLKSGATDSADLYVDCSGFASLLLGKALSEPYRSYKSTLFCDRAVVGGWTRTHELIKPYTTCETMNSGWCWQIEHEGRINRGYVYSSDFITDDAAEQEFRQKNPLVGPTRIVRFPSGRYERRWVKNVVAIGNASGFVEPLEATALGVIALQSRHLAQTLLETDGDPTATQIVATNAAHAIEWDSIRKFLAVHYRFNDRIDTPFWRACQQDVDLAGAEPIVEYYRENGPVWYWAPINFTVFDQFAFNGYATMLMGQRVPFRKTHTPTEAELKTWEARRQRLKGMALKAMTVREALDAIHAPRWKWGMK